MTKEQRQAALLFLLNRGIQQSNICSLFNISIQTVSSIASGENWPDFVARTDLPAALDALDVAEKRIAELEAPAVKA